MKKEMMIPNKINELNEKLNIKSDKYDGNVDVRTCIRASIDLKASKTVKRHCVTCVSTMRRLFGLADISDRGRCNEYQGSNRRYNKT